MTSLNQKTIQKLTKISPSYNSFVPDQVLTHTQLNGIIDFFEDQNRMTRLRLSGSGIVCGFELSVVANKLNLSQGTGITTDGDLVYNTTTDGTDVVTHCDAIEFSNFIEYDDSKNDYFKDLIPAYKDGAILELLPTGVTVSDSIPVEPIDLNAFPTPQSDGLDQYVFFIYVEAYEKEAGACTSTSCENQGNERVHNIHYLMVPKLYALHLINTYDTHYQEKQSYTTLQDGLKKLQVKRLIFHDGTNVMTANTEEEVAGYYHAAIQDGTTLTDLKSGFNNLCAKFGLSTFDSEIDTWLSFSAAAAPSDIQYRFDLFKDLVETYNEARDLLLELDTYCCPDIHAFPKHLMVSGFNVGKKFEFDRTFRHSFYESPIVGQDRNNYLKVMALIERARTLATLYTSSGKGDKVTITPSNLSGTLGSKAIPFYYSHTRGLLNAWDYDKTYNRLEDTHLSYNKGLLSSQSAIQNPLAYTIDENDFYRIEGHQGLAPQAVKDELEVQKRKFGLDFDVLIVDVNETDPTLSTLVEKRPSITHLAGVPKGGTFILASQKNSVFADFAIGDKIPAENKGIGCCPLVECSYPFISSLKYLNNLSRSLNGTQSNDVTMPTHYRLAISRYEINGKSLKSYAGPELVEIPLTEIFLNRAHAIMRALNTRYPKGVVFDYNESQKRMTITRSKYDKYVIEMQDVTLSSLQIAPFQPIYTYSTTGMYCASSSPRKGLPGTHRPFVMVCRELREYNEAFYESLQGRFAPVGKDDDYTEYRKDWERLYKLKWRLPKNKQINDWQMVRFIKNQNEIPGPWRELLSKMMNDMNGALQLYARELMRKAKDSKELPSMPALRYVLDGDWVTGEYVEHQMLDLWKLVKGGKTRVTPEEQEIHDFVELKGHLHEDHNITKMSIYVQGIQYNPIFDPVIKAYDAAIDFYFSCAPRGEWAIPIDFKPPTGGGDNGGDNGGGNGRPVGELPDIAQPDIPDGVRPDLPDLPDIVTPGPDIVNPEPDIFQPDLGPVINPGPIDDGTPIGPGTFNPIPEPDINEVIPDLNPEIINPTPDITPGGGTDFFGAIPDVSTGGGSDFTNITPNVTTEGNTELFNTTGSFTDANITGTEGGSPAGMNPSFTAGNFSGGGARLIPESGGNRPANTNSEISRTDVSPPTEFRPASASNAMEDPSLKKKALMENLKAGDLSSSENLQNPAAFSANRNIDAMRAVPETKNVAVRGGVQNPIALEASTNIPMEVRSAKQPATSAPKTARTASARKQTKSSGSAKSTATTKAASTQKTTSVKKTAAAKTKSVTTPKKTTANSTKSTTTRKTTAAKKATATKAKTAKTVSNATSTAAKKATAKKATATKKKTTTSRAKTATAAKKTTSTAKKATTVKKAAATKATPKRKATTAKKTTARKTTATRGRNTKK